MIALMAEFKTKKTGYIPPEHYSHDHLNEQREVPVEQDRLTHWFEVFRRIQDKHEKVGEKIVWVMVDGFLLYWHKVRFSRTGCPTRSRSGIDGNIFGSFVGRSGRTGRPRLPSCPARYPEEAQTRATRIPYSR